jgi:hypothetical protein
VGAVFLLDLHEKKSTRLSWTSATGDSDETVYTIRGLDEVAGRLTVVRSLGDQKQTTQIIDLRKSAP